MLSTLRHRVTLKPNVQTSDLQGSWTTGYPESAHIEVWAAVQPMSGPERAQYRRVESDVSTRCVIRASSAPDLTGDWLVEFRDQEYEIESVIEPGMRGRHMTLLLKERS